MNSSSYFTTSLPTRQHWEKTTQGTDLLTDNQRQIFQIVNYVIICSAVGLFGIVANLINIIIFFRQGFATTINISLFALAISDLCGLLTLEWYGLCVNPLFINSHIIIAPSEVRHLTAATPHAYFVRTTGWITAFVTAERCFCILFPLKVKQLITPRRVGVLIFCIYFLNMITILPEYYISHIGWKFYPEKNQTLLGLIFKEERLHFEGLAFVLSAISGITSFTVVILFTLILVIKLKQQSQWRSKSVGNDKQRNGTSSRDKQTMSMVAVIAAVLIGCYSPGAMCNLVTFAIPEISVVGRYSNVLFVMYSFSFVSESINSSINIFFYFKMSSKYRKEFHNLFSTCSNRENQMRKRRDDLDT